MRNEKGEITIKSVWKWLRTDVGKRYSFFIFYLFFFIFLFIVFSVTSNYETPEYENNETNNNNSQVEESLPFSIKNLENDYTFTYKRVVDDLSFEYLGNRRGSKITLLDDMGVYEYNYQNSTLVETNTANEDIIYKFLDVYEFRRLIKNSTYISKTEYASNESLYTYEVSNSTLHNILGKDIENGRLMNQIKIQTNNKNIIEEVEFDITNFISQKDNKQEKIIITYEDNNE